MKSLSRLLRVTGVALAAAIRWPLLETARLLQATGRGVAGAAQAVWNGFLATGRTVIHAVTGAVTEIEHAILRGFRVLRHGFGRLLHGLRRSFINVLRGFFDLFRQIGSDLRHLARYSAGRCFAGGKNLIKALGKISLIILAPLRLVLRPITVPLRRSMTRHARDEALGMTTPDHASHKEILLLVIFVAALVIGGLAYLDTLQLPGATVRLPDLSPQAVLTRLATYSPLQMTGLAGAATVILFAVWFWLGMLHDSYRRHYESQTEATKWKLVTTLFFVPGAVYYFWKVYNHWSFRQFVTYHLLSVMITGVAVLVTSSTGGALYYFSQKANAETKAAVTTLPKIEVDAKTKASLETRTRYGQPLTPNATGGRTDPFAPIPGQEVAPVPGAATAPSPSPSPSASPRPSPGV